MGMTECEKFIHYLRYEKRYSSHTVLAYRNDLEQLFGFLQITYDINDIKELTPQMLRTWMVDQADKKQSNRTINRKLSAFKAFFRFLKKEGLIEENPLSKVQSPKAPKRLPSFVKEDKMELLFNENLFTDDFRGLRDSMVMELLYASGIRVSELTGLRESDVDFQRMALKVLGKRNKERYIPFGLHFKKKLEEYLTVKHNEFLIVDKNEGYLIVTDKGYRTYQKMIYRIVNKYLSFVTTQDKKSPHVLRHTFATHLLNHGADLNAIKEILGHASLSATQVYTHNSIEKLKKIYKLAHPKA